MENIVTIGTTLMANTSDSYASFAVLMYQAFGRKVQFSASLLSLAILVQMSCGITQLAWHCASPAAACIACVTTHLFDALDPSHFHVQLAHDCCACRHSMRPASSGMHTF